MILIPESGCAVVKSHDHLGNAGLTVEDDDAIRMARELARVEALAVGISSGAMAVAALQVGKRPEMKDKTIVTLFADFTERYISTEIFDGL